MEHLVGTRAEVVQDHAMEDDGPCRPALGGGSHGSERSALAWVGCRCAQHDGQHAEEGGVLMIGRSPRRCRCRRRRAANRALQHTHKEPRGKVDAA